MRTLTALSLLVAAAADHGTWDHPQQAELPSHEWIVVDHAPGTSFGLGVCVAGNAVFTDDAKCWAWYAPYECPTSSCQATNDDEWGRTCMAPGVLDNCFGPDTECGPGPNAAPAEGGGGGGSKKKKKSSNDSLALGLGLGLGLGGLLLIGLIAALCLSKKQKASTSTREQDVENEMVKTGAAMS